MSAIANFFGPDVWSSDDDDDSALTTAESSASLPPEPETGNIEYKLKLDDLSPSRFEELVTQMKWRLHEGQGRAEYVIGVNDDGVVVGLSRLVFDRSIRNLQKMASKLDAEVHVPEVMTTTETKLWAKVIVAAVIEASVVGLDDLRVAFVGAAGCGKSSLISVISRQRPDDGHGSARLHLFQHRHEISSGRTSSIITETVGWDKNDRLVRDPDLGRALRTLTMIDLAGHEKYIRTTLYGLTAHNPHLIVLVVNAASNARKFWLNARFLRCLGRPLVIVLNKIELSDQNRIEHLVKTISAESNVVLKMVANHQEAAQIAHQLNSSAYAANQCFMSPAWVSKYEKTESVSAATNATIPVFTCSCVNEGALDSLLAFFSKIVWKRRIRRKDKRRSRGWFRVLSLLKVTETEVVLGGLMARGQLVADDEEYFFGPFRNNQFKRVIVKSIRSHNAPCSRLLPGQYGSVALKGLQFESKKLNLKGLTVFATKPPTMCLDFVALVVFHRIREEPSKRPTKPSKMMKSKGNGLEMIVHTNNTCQSGVITRISEKDLRLDRPTEVKIRFIHKAEFICRKALIILRHNSLMGVGRVLSTNPIKK